MVVLLWEVQEEEEQVAKHPSVLGFCAGSQNRCRNPDCKQDRNKFKSNFMSMGRLAVKNIGSFLNI